MQNFGIWGIIGTGGQSMWFSYSLCNFYGATMMIKGSLLLSAPIVKHFQSTLVW